MTEPVYLDDWLTACVKVCVLPYMCSLCLVDEREHQHHTVLSGESENHKQHCDRFDGFDWQEFESEKIARSQEAFGQRMYNFNVFMSTRLVCAICVGVHWTWMLSSLMRMPLSHTFFAEAIQIELTCDIFHLFLSLSLLFFLFFFFPVSWWFNLCQYRWQCYRLCLCVCVLCMRCHINESNNRQIKWCRDRATY